MESNETTSGSGNSDYERHGDQEKMARCAVISLGLDESRLEAADDTPETLCKPSRWQQIAILTCGFFASFQTLGVAQAYGMFQLFHRENFGKPTSIISDNEAQNRAAIALVGSLGGSGLCLILGLCIVPFLCQYSTDINVSEKFRPRTWLWRSNVSMLSAAGSFLVILGYIIASFSTQLWHLMFSQGITVGIGYALLYNPIMMIAPEYFGPKVQGKAMGLISAGAGVGGLAYSPIVRLLDEQIGIRWTLRFLGTFTGLTGLLFVAAFAPPPRPCNRRTFLPKKVLTDPILYLAIIGGFTYSLTSLIPFGFGPEFSVLLDFSTKSAAIQLAVLNAVGTPARVFWGHLRDKIGSQNTLILASALLAISNFMWLGAAKTNGKVVWWAFLIIWGIGTSGFGTVIATYVLDIFDSEVYFGILAVINVARGFGGIIGSPVAGVIIGNGISSEEHGSCFLKLITFNGALLLITVVALLLARILHGRRVGWKWMA
jgi:MFS family permease